MSSFITYSKVKKFVDDKALIFVGLLFAAFCTFFTMAYWISFMNFGWSSAHILETDENNIQNPLRTIVCQFNTVAIVTQTK